MTKVLRLWLLGWLQGVPRSPQAASPAGQQHPQQPGSRRRGHGSATRPVRAPGWGAASLPCSPPAPCGIRRCSPPDPPEEGSPKAGARDWERAGARAPCRGPSPRVCGVSPGRDSGGGSRGAVRGSAGVRAPWGGVCVLQRVLWVRAPQGPTPDLSRGVSPAVCTPEGGVVLSRAPGGHHTHPPCAGAASAVRASHRSARAPSRPVPC